MSIIKMAIGGIIVLVVSGIRYKMRHSEVKVMKEFEALYSMGGIAYGGYFKSVVVAHNASNVKGLLNETHGEEVKICCIEETKNSSDCKHEQVVSTIEA